MGVLLWTALTACFFIAQGIYVLKTGCARGLLASADAKERTPTRAPLAMRMYYAALWLGGGIAIIILLFLTALKRKVTLGLVWENLRAVGLDFVWPMLLALIGALAMFRPSVVLAWVQRSHPDLDVNDPAAKAFVKVLGLVIWFGATVILFAFVS